MAEDRQPGAADSPDDDTPKPDTPGPENPGPDQPYRLGGSGQGSGGGGSGSGGFGGGGGPIGFGGTPGGQNPGGQNQGNPFEALFSSLAGGDMNALAAQLQSAFSMLGGAGALFGGTPTDPGSGVNWQVTKDTARRTVAALGADPTPTAGQRAAVREAVALAEVWLDEATALPRVSSTVSAWSRAEWVENTLPVWRRLVEPIASSIADAMEGALSSGNETTGLPGLAGMEQMLRPMLRTSGASMFGLQLGQGLGRLATEVVGVTDIGLPLAEPGQLALLPTNVAAFGEGLDQPSSDVTLYLALRECARQRLFASAVWLRSEVLLLVEQYAHGITIDTSAIEEAIGRIDPSNLEELGATLEGGLFEPQKTPEQQATLARLETMLALVEGWVDEVVTQATARLMPSAAALAETVRRTRAAGGPAEATFATLVGLELRPRRLRDAANLWAAVRDARGVDGRDAVWSHPDLAPTTADLDDPLGFVTRDSTQQAAEDDFDAALAELLDSSPSTPDGPAPTTEEPEGPDSGSGPDQAR